MGFVRSEMSIETVVNSVIDPKTEAIHMMITYRRLGVARGRARGGEDGSERERKGEEERGRGGKEREREKKAGEREGAVGSEGAVDEEMERSETGSRRRIQTPICKRQMRQSPGTKNCSPNCPPTAGDLCG